MADNKNIPKKKNFWGGVGRTSNRGKIFWLDIETTGLGRDVTALGPERFSEVAKALKSQTTLKEKLGIFKELPEYKFFKDIGLAQFVTASKGSGGAPNWHHGAGYTIWEDSVHDTLMSKRVTISDFSRIKGIGQRSINAGLANEANTMPSMLKSFSRKLLDHTASGTSTVRGWNVWFDVWATQAFMAQHAEDLQRAGLDPFGLIKAVGSKRLRVESMEESYFDLLAWRGLKDTGWAKKNLRYGRMFGAKMGEGPGATIPIHDYVARRKEGLPNLLRGRTGWKAEKLENIFNEYGALDKGLKSWKFPGGKSFDAWSAHDAVRDVASEYELSRKFRRINKALSVFESRGAPLGAFRGVAEGEAFSALAFARAGILGEQFSGIGMRGSQWNKMVSQSGVSKEILRRSRGIWGSIEAQSPGMAPYVSSGASERIASPYGDYFRRLWNRDISGLSTADIRGDVTAKLTKAKNAWRGSSRLGKFGMAGIAAYALYTAFGRQQETIDANIPYNGFEGMGHGFGQAASRRLITGSGATGELGFGSGWRGIVNIPAILGAAMFGFAPVEGIGAALTRKGLDAARRVTIGTGVAESAMPYWPTIIRKNRRLMSETPKRRAEFKAFISQLQDAKRAGHHAVIGIRGDVFQKIKQSGILEEKGISSGRYLKNIIHHERIHYSRMQQGIYGGEELSFAAPALQESFRRQGYAVGSATSPNILEEGLGYRASMQHLGEEVFASAFSAYSPAAIEEIRKFDLIPFRSTQPHNYIKGQQSKSKAIKVPWSSPWEGIATDDRSAVEMLAKGGIAAGSAYAFHNLPGIVGRLGAPGVANNIIHGARFMEDVLPFRLGRMFNVGSFWSSFSTPSDYSLGFKHLVSEGVITDVGRTYASVMDISEFDFVKSINASKLRGYSALEHTKISANSPFMRIRMDDIGDFNVRMFDVTTRLGNTFGAMGTESLQTRNLSSQAQAKRVSHILRDAIPVGEMGLGRRILRGASKLFPGAIGSAVGRWASVPTWDTNPFRALQKSEAMAEQLLFVPGYTRGKTGIVRAARGLGRDAIKSGYAAIRQSAAIVGIPMAGAKTMRGMTSSTIKAGAVVFGAMWAFGKLNNSLGGVLTSPFFNIWERAMLARASFSDATGLTGLREQLPDVQTTALFGVVGAGAGTALAYKYGVRAKGLFDQYRGSIGRSYSASTWGIDEVGGFGTDLREASFVESKIKASRDIKNFLFRPGLTDEWGPMLSAKHYLKWSSLSGRGKAAVGILGGMAVLAAPFLLGSKQSRSELEEIYAGNRNVEVKRGRWWELGSTPYEGGRTHYFRRHQIARRKLRAENRVPGEGHNGIWGLIKSISDPYWREKEAYYDRPTPVTGGTALREIPLIGPILDAIVGGGLLKPQKYMHREEWAAGQNYEQYPGGIAPNASLGGLSSPTPRDPTGLAAQVRELSYRGTELMGLRGYLMQSISSQRIYGGDMPFDQARVLEPARFGQGATDSFWEADMGGMAGANEVFRRFFPRPERGTEVNPLRNRMPSWLPGDNYFINFRQGDPYSKVRYGAERLPGAGYEALNPEMSGIDPENYSAFHKYKILADVAPWAAETRSARGAAYAATRDPARLEALDRIDREVEQVKQKKDFKEYSFLAGRETIRGTVTGVGMDGEIRLAEYQNHSFKLAGLNFGPSAVADQLRRQNNMTKSAATERAAQAGYERQALLQDLMVGGMVTISIGKGGLNRPDVAGTFTMNGTNINKLLIDRGLAGNEGGAPTAGRLSSLYGGAMEAIGHFPQKIPGPWMAMTKFFNQADPMEEYRRDVLYGSNNRFWDSPWKNFVRPYLHQTLSKLTPGEYIPAHVQETREFDVVLDRTKFLKYAQSGELGKARRTMAGGDMYGDPSQIEAALPARDKPFFEAFRQETDPGARKRILSMVSQDMQRALVGQWTSQYAATQGKRTSQRNDIGSAVQMAQSQLKRLGRGIPSRGWSGNDPAIDWEDIKAVMVQNEGADTHDYNIWDDRTQSLLRKPYVYGAVEGLTSRRMPTNINSMSSSVGGNHVIPFATINHSLSFSMNMSNNVNYSAWENAQYKRNIDRVGGF